MRGNFKNLQFGLQVRVQFTEFQVQSSGFRVQGFVFWV